MAVPSEPLRQQIASQLNQMDLQPSIVESQVLQVNATCPEMPVHSLDTAQRSLACAPGPITYIDQTKLPGISHSLYNLQSSENFLRTNHGDDTVLNYAKQISNPLFWPKHTNAEATATRFNLQHSQSYTNHTSIHSTDTSSIRGNEQAGIAHNSGSANAQSVGISLNNPERPSNANAANEYENLDEPSDKRQRYLERNRVAASKCRQKRKEHREALERELAELSEKNRHLEGAVIVLSGELKYLQEMLTKQRNCNCYPREE